ncbi:hypothetical protein D9M70_498000 [compost metagenome]
MALEGSVGDATHIGGIGNEDTLRICQDRMPGQHGRPATGDRDVDRATDLVPAAGCLGRDSATPDRKAAGADLLHVGARTIDDNGDGATRPGSSNDTAADTGNVVPVDPGDDENISRAEQIDCRIDDGSIAAGRGDRDCRSNCLGRKDRRNSCPNKSKIFEVADGCGFDTLQQCSQCVWYRFRLFLNLVWLGHRRDSDLPYGSQIRPGARRMSSSDA